VGADGRIVCRNVMQHSRRLSLSGGWMKGDRTYLLAGMLEESMNSLKSIWCRAERTPTRDVYR
jgi:hypothetical protein